MVETDFEAACLPNRLAASRQLNIYSATPEPHDLLAWDRALCLLWAGLEPGA